MNSRYLRLTDGPDEVHMSQLGKQKITELCGLPVR
jgi:acyl-CoA dehydrogenase